MLPSAGAVRNPIAYYAMSARPAASARAAPEALYATARGTAVLHVVLSHGGLATPAAVERVPIQLVESGPAGGAQVAAHHAERLPSPRALAFDMGGTTAKVCLVADGVPRVTHHVEVARVHRLKRGSGLPLT